MPTINDLSVISFPIELFFNDTFITHATAFIWQKNGINFLITNWHVITGKNPLTGELMHPMGARPNNFKLFGFHPENIGNRFIKTFEIYHNGEPSWYEHAIYRENVDVVAFALAPTDEFKVFPINEITSFDSVINIGNDVFILGFPFTPKKENFWLPVWKKGSIATEPAIDQDGLPFLYVDSAARSGMSGSPVIIKKQGVGISCTNAIEIGDFSSSFVGVFSGRLTGDDLEAQLCRVWKNRVIDEVIDGKCLGVIEQP